MYGLTADLVKMLQESSVLMDQWAYESCANKTKGGMEEWAKKNGVVEDKKKDEFSCDWYHSTWQYLRLLNMVAVPNWYPFYNQAIGKVLKDKPNAKVFISACADYGMLAKLHEAIKETKADPTIIIYDICSTPLKSCVWYAERNGLKVTCKTGNIIDDEIPEAPFDLIVTDEFLSVLADEYKPQITKKWKQILKPDGVVITTAMIGKPTTPELRKGFENRAKALFEVNGKMMFPFIKDGEENKLIEKFVKFAEVHTRHMLGSEDILKDLFKDYKHFSYNLILTPGECVNPQPTYEIVASPGC